ncbi:MAG: excinuclease ABC subunit UvrA [Opitutales bacterium]|jgi:excinuclease ABC subunit A|nr:excinuclease ABC subunit UvrA [Opitutales bacterium]MDP4895109.1 excinuclease ABC subunit UvrA [Opitutales bacterium]
MPAPRPDAIRLRGVRQNNLKGFDVDIPVGKLVVVTGLSGAGKSSLVFDTLHAEGQRRYVETFSPYVRQFLELLPSPALDSAENVRPSVAIKQGNAVRTSRSTVGTMTELCDWFKVWFAHRAELVDPASGQVIVPRGPDAAWSDSLARFPGQSLSLAFAVAKPASLGWPTIAEEFAKAGFSRAFAAGRRIRLTEDEIPADATELLVIQDRVTIAPDQASRFHEAALAAFRLGGARLRLLDDQGNELSRYSEVLESPVDGRKFRPASPALFSFNSPVGACPECRGFGRVIGLDWHKIIPNPALTLAEGAIAPFQGTVYGESQKDLTRACRKAGIPMDVPWKKLSAAHRKFVEHGEPGYVQGSYDSMWYGVRGFFRWLEGTTYKMHVRVFLSRWRAYESCPKCQGRRFREESLFWRWQGRTLPELYASPVSDLRAMLAPLAPKDSRHPADHALEAILARLGYLEAVGLGYLALDRLSRTLSGGEVQRVNLTSCLGACLADTVFVLDEPSVGMHARDLARMVGILRSLVDQGNTVVVVEHDESVMRAADWLIEIGPRPGAEGGHLLYQGVPKGILKVKESATGNWLSGRRTPETRAPRPIGDTTPRLRVSGATVNNLRDFSCSIPLGRMVGLCGVSGSGKSTLLHQVIGRRDPESGDEAAELKWVKFDKEPAEVALVDQSPATRTPRSNPALYVGAWDAIRTLLGNSPEAKAAGLTPSHFSFNAGEGRCERCGGAGWETVEMQFVSDVALPCPSCNGKRFRDEVLSFQYDGKSVGDLLAMSVTEARKFLGERTPASAQLACLEEVGLGYLSMGQPLTTLSGGEAQRLKLVRYLSKIDARKSGALLLLDEPTTGLHREDVSRLVGLLHRLTEAGHSLIVVEHHLDVLKSCDWLLEMGPEAGPAGGRLVAEGTPAEVAQAGTVTGRFLAQGDDAFASASTTPSKPRPTSISLRGAREHNLKDVSLEIPHGSLTVMTGVSGSGKSSLAFDILFAEGQRRFLECVSAYARQFVEQLPKPDIDSLTGLPPTVAIEQRVTRGSAKSTVATVTEVAQYLRVLFARAGVLHSPTTGEPLEEMTEDAVVRLVAKQAKSLKRGSLLIAAPLVRARKGHHRPLAEWAETKGLRHLRCDGKLLKVDGFEGLDRYSEHDVDAVFGELRADGLILLPDETEESGEKALRTLVRQALAAGKNACVLLAPDGRQVAYLSTSRSDPATGESFPEVDPKHLSWNSPRGWCPDCRGHGLEVTTFSSDEEESINENAIADRVGEAVCPTCHGERLGPIGRSVKLAGPKGRSLSLPGLLRLQPDESLAFLSGLKLEAREKAIVGALLPEIAARLRFLDSVGLGYLALDRGADTLSGGEAQRIRLAAQLGSTLSGALYVLDEPSIGLHPRDNDRLIGSLKGLRDRGNTVLVVEHDEDTMRAADLVVDMGPGAGVHGGEIVAQGTAAALEKRADSVTGRFLKEAIPHPLRGARRQISGKGAPAAWVRLKDASLRNLKGFDVQIPVGRLTVVCGVSGAGKSTLVTDLLAPAIRAAIAKKKDGLTGKEALSVVSHEGKPAFGTLSGLKGFRQLVVVDQEPIGKTPRSTPATYVGAWDLIRERLASLPEAAIRGHGAGFFSFNTSGGRCEACSGAGRIKLEMSFLPDTYVPCEECAGTRYGSAAKAIRWNGKSAADLLAMTFEEAAAFLSFDAKLGDLCGLMVKTGLGYLTLGQSSPTLSGGEAQRLKLVSELAQGLPTFRERSRGEIRPNLYILEEPTIGLHQSDCRRLIELLHALVDQGHTVVVIEHHPDVIAEADWVIEIGPEGGNAGGQLVHAGDPESLAKLKKSPTAPSLRLTLERGLVKKAAG